MSPKNVHLPLSSASLLHRPSLTILFPRPLHQIPTLLSQTQRILRTRPSPTVRFPSPIMLQTNPTSLLRQHNQRPSFLHPLLPAVRLPLPLVPRGTRVPRRVKRRTVRPHSRLVAGRSRASPHKHGGADQVWNLLEGSERHHKVLLSPRSLRP